jgi:salicylate hydroxylase
MKKIAIIGAGISGLFFANLLEKNKSYSYKIFEKKNSIDLNDGYGIQLSVNSTKLLNNIGFSKFSKSQLYFPKKVNFLNAHDSKKICDIDLSKFNDENNRYTTLKRSNLIKFLLDGIPKDKLTFNCELKDIKQGDKISLLFSDKKTDEFDYLVSADGIYSKTKQILFKTEGLPEYFNTIALRGTIRDFNSSDISLYLGSNFHFVIYPINQNKEFDFNFKKNLLNQISSKSNLNLFSQLEKIKCFPIFVSRRFEIPHSNNIFLTGDAFYSFPPSFAQGASQSIESANELFNDLQNNASSYYKKRVLRTKQIISRSKLNHFAFHLSNPINIFFRNIFLKYLSKNKKFLESYLGKVYNN